MLVRHVDAIASSQTPMRYWWVNQNQTYAHEMAGGYLWSPKRRADGKQNPFYEFMREVSPGDLILSFVDTYIPAVGIAESYCYECPKPAEFGKAGAYWDQIGWKADVHYRPLSHKIRTQRAYGKASATLAGQVFTVANERFWQPRGLSHRGSGRPYGRVR